jgi:hypothetical protein
MKTTLPAALLMAGLVAGCGSGGNGGSTNDGGVPPGGAGLSWKDNGTMLTATFATGTRTKSSMLDMLQVVGANSAERAVALGVSTRPPLVPGTYTCNASATNGVVVTIVVDEATMWSGCTITIGTLGETTGTRATGSFSATFTDAGNTKTVTDGLFDVALTVSTLPGV